MRRCARRPAVRGTARPRVRLPCTMRIAFDLDGVLADLQTPFSRAACELFPHLVPADPPPPDVIAPPADPDSEEAEEEVAEETATPPELGARLTRQQSGAVWKHLGQIENFWETLGEIEPGAIARLASLTEEQRWEVIFVTSRPHVKGVTVQRQSQRWLQ